MCGSGLEQNTYGAIYEEHDDADGDDDDDDDGDDGDDDDVFLFLLLDNCIRILQSPPRVAGCTITAAGSWL
jgi:hypothetical protein